MRSLACLVMLVGCGRIAFDSLSTVPNDASDGNTTTSTVDASCVGGDDSCAAECVGIDSDCMTTCGDGRCVGNAGEKCGNCAMDCATMSAVCGNGLCDGGETSTSCMTDCGPSPWPFAALEQQLLVEINNARTMGVMCPGDNMPRTAGVLAAGADPNQGARNLAWQIAHQPGAIANLTTCNGKTFLQLENAVGYSGGLFSKTTGTPASIVDQMKTTMNVCQRMMMPYTEASVGHADDIDVAWVVFLR